ncbi:uncharacterized protein LOC122757078 [Drosophila mojavensis]|uniref:uncharacterized protein LOC122757077 n=1 Tax=Drosophila mojavensis TaxID=7230 RepID=UPI001CD0D6BA|nr:uncharacterized protein LOC122757077 [Drosophila mojavensis]XP_043864382.1 uncharacterized protein LOC122757078 [Drosophila mojavensis]
MCSRSNLQCICCNQLLGDDPLCSAGGLSGFVLCVRKVPVVGGNGASCWKIGRRDCEAAALPMLRATSEEDECVAASFGGASLRRAAFFCLYALTEHTLMISYSL